MMTNQRKRKKKKKKKKIHPFFFRVPAQGQV